MKAEFRKLKVSLVFAILLSVAFIGIVNLNDEGTASGQVDGFRGIVYFRVEDGHQDITPGDSVNYNLTIDYKIKRPWGSPVDSDLWGYFGPTTITLTVEGDEEEWVTANIPEKTIRMSPTDKEREISMSVYLSQDAPYFQRKKLTIIAEAEKTGVFGEDRQEIEITYKPNFIKNADATTDERSVLVRPRPERYQIPIEVSNFNQGVGMQFHFEISGVPEGWSVSPPNSIVVSPNGKLTSYASVRPPHDFGYYQEGMSFTVDVYVEPHPYASEKIYLKTLTFDVDTQGFSTTPTGAGFLVMMGIVVLLIVVLLLFFMFKSGSLKKKITEPEEKTLISKPVVEKKPEKPKDEPKKEEKKTEDSKKTEMKTKSSDKTYKLDAIKRIKEQEDKDKKKKL